MNIRMRSIGTLVSAGTLGIVAALGMGAAQADPASTTDYRNLAGVGSDTTTPVINAMANDPVALAISGVRQVASYNATGSATIDPKDPAVLPACNDLPRPNGSGSGRVAFLNSVNANGGAGDGCYQFARASALHTDATEPNLVYIPFAGENFTFAINNASSLPKNLTNAQVIGLFDCSIPAGHTAMFPNNGSGTFEYWSNYVFGSPGNPDPLPSCIQTHTDEFGNLIQEHNGTQVSPTEIVPFSVAQWTSQVAGIIATDVRGNTRLGQVDSQNPFGAGFPINRPLFNVITQIAATNGTGPEGGDGSANNGAIQRTVFVGPSALACNAASAAIMSKFGLTVSPLCGDTSLVTP